jgi:hypothetical protein
MTSQHFCDVYKAVEHQQRTEWMYNVNNVKSLSGQNCKRFGFAPKDVLIVDTFLKTMLCVSFSICTFTINHNFSLFKHLSYNMTSYYNCFVSWNRKIWTLDILQEIRKQTWRFYLLIQNCENWVFHTRFFVLLCSKISEEYFLIL